MDKYDERTSELLRSPRLLNEADRVAQTLGVPRDAILGAIAEEYNSKISGDWIHRTGDRIADWWGSSYPGPKLAQDFSDVGRERSLLNMPGTRTKKDHPTLIDYGPGNVKLFTAIELLKKYNDAHPDSDPLDLKKIQ